MGDISPHYSRSEFVCKCGCGLDRIDLRLMPIAELIRVHEGNKPMSPLSGCRCLQHNERVQMDVNEHYVPYSSKSKHLPLTEYNTVDEENGICTAGDFGSENPKKLYDFLCNLFPNLYGIGLYSWGVHIDVGGRYARWGDK